jgi:hypothetical protein
LTLKPFLKLAASSSTPRAPSPKVSTEFSCRKIWRENRKDFKDFGGKIKAFKGSFKRKSNFALSLQVYKTNNKFLLSKIN